MAKCAECGFISVRNKNTRELEEVERDEEVNVGLLFLQEKVNDEEVGVERKHEFPLCFILKYNLGKEYGDLSKLDTSDINDKIFKILYKERVCNSFTKWQQGFTPKEHREMMDRKAMVEIEDKRRENDRNWQIKQLWFMVLVAGIFTILGGGIGAIIALLASGK